MLISRNFCESPHSSDLSITQLIEIDRLSAIIKSVFPDIYDKVDSSMCSIEITSEGEGQGLVEVKKIKPISIESIKRSSIAFLVKNEEYRYIMVLTEETSKLKKGILFRKEPNMEIKFGLLVEVDL